MRAPLTALFCALALTACDTAIFAPTVDPAIAADLSKANDALLRISACVELGSCPGKAQFAKVEDDYVTAFAAVTAARLKAGKINAARSPADTALALFLDEISECEAAIKRMHDAHRRFASIAEAGLVRPTLITCDAPLDAARALG